MPKYCLVLLPQTLIEFLTCTSQVLLMLTTSLTVIIFIQGKYTSRIAVVGLSLSRQIINRRVLKEQIYCSNGTLLDCIFLMFLYILLIYEFSMPDNNGTLNL